MKSIKKNKAPNVVSGTHYNLDRFKELYSWINALQMDSISICLAPYESGLLYFDETPSTKPLKLSGSELQIAQCCGVTRNGGMIGIFENETVQKSYDTDNLIGYGIYEILLSVDHVNRTPKGEADEAEVPFRQPFSDPTYNLDIFKKGEKNEKGFSNALKLGELSKSENGIELLGFIPSCKNVGAHPDLDEKYNVYKDKFSKLLASLQRIILLCSKEMDTDITNLAKLSNQLGYYIASEKKVFEKGKHTNTLDLFNFCKSFASILNFHFFSITRQTQLLKMIEQNVKGYTGVSFTEQDFRAVLKRLCDESFNHLNLKENLDVIDQFIEVVINRGFDLLGQRDKLFPFDSGGQLQNPVNTPPPPPSNSGSGFF